MNDGGATISHRRYPNNRLAQAFGCAVILWWFCPRSLAPTGAAEESQDRLAIQRDYDLFAIASGLASSIDWNYYPPREVPAMPLAPEPAAKWTQTSFTQNSPQDGQSRLKKDLLN